MKIWVGECIEEGYDTLTPPHIFTRTCIRTPTLALSIIRHFYPSNKVGSTSSTFFDIFLTNSKFLPAFVLKILKKHRNSLYFDNLPLAHQHDDLLQQNFQHFVDIWLKIISAKKIF